MHSCWISLSRCRARTTTNPEFLPGRYIQNLSNTYPKNVKEEKNREIQGKSESCSMRGASCMPWDASVSGSMGAGAATRRRLSRVLSLARRAASRTVRSRRGLAETRRFVLSLITDRAARQAPTARDPHTTGLPITMVRRMRCVPTRKRPGIFPSGWLNTRTCPWASRNACFARSRALTA